MARVRLSRLKDGESGTVVDIQGDVVFLETMDLLGFKKGRVVQKTKTVKQAGIVIIHVRIIDIRHEVVMSFKEAENIIVETREFTRPPVYNNDFAYA